MITLRCTFAIRRYFHYYWWCYANISLPRLRCHYAFIIICYFDAMLIRAAIIYASRAIDDYYALSHYADYAMPPPPILRCRHYAIIFAAIDITPLLWCWASAADASLFADAMWQRTCFMTLFRFFHWLRFDYYLMLFSMIITPRRWWCHYFDAMPLMMMMILIRRLPAYAADTIVTLMIRRHYFAMSADDIATLYAMLLRHDTPLLLLPPPAMPLLIAAERFDMPLLLLIFSPPLYSFDEATFSFIRHCLAPLLLSLLLLYSFSLFSPLLL